MEQEVAKQEEIWKPLLFEEQIIDNYYISNFGNIKKIIKF
jgi:hypothetical protein